MYCKINNWTPPTNQHEGSNFGTIRGPGHRSKKINKTRRLEDDSASFAASTQSRDKILRSLHIAGRFFKFQVCDTTCRVDPVDPARGPKALLNDSRFSCFDEVYFQTILEIVVMFRTGFAAQKLAEKIRSYTIQNSDIKR